MHTNDIILIFPPMFNPGYFYLGLPSLKAYLEMYGYNAHILEANIILNDIILSKKFLEETFSEQQERVNIFSSEIEKLIDNIEKAKNSFRNERFYSPQCYMNALYTIHKTREVINKVFEQHGGLLIENFGAYRYQRNSHLASKLIMDDKVVYASLYEKYIIPEILRYNTKLIGISITFTDQLIPSLILAKKLKDINKDFKIIAGGNIVTHLHKNKNFLKLLSLSNVDIGIVYEGEHSLLMITELFHKKEELPKKIMEIPNVVYLVSRHSCKLPQRIHIPDVNSLPTPDFNGLPFDKYLTPHLVFPLLTSRGCYWSKCVFCSIPYGYGSKYRLRDAELVVSDLLSLRDKYDAKYIAFRDCCISPEHMYNICKKIMDNGLDVRMYAEIRAEEMFTYKHFKKAYEAGFRMLWVGVESYNQKILDLMKKGINLKGITSCLKSLKRAGIWAHIYVIIGFPGETRKETLETIKFILSNRNLIDSVEFSSFTLVENSPIILQNLAEKYGIARKNLDGDLSLVYRYILKKNLLQEETEKIIEDLNFVSSNKSQLLFNLMIPSYETWALLYISKWGADSVKKMLRTLISLCKEKFGRGLLNKIHNKY